MKATVDAIRAALTAAGVANYFVEAPGTAAMPYALVWTGGGMPPTEDAVQPVGDFEDIVGVTVTAGSAEGVLSVQGRVRAALAAFSPSPVVPGRLTWLSLFDSRAVRVDRDVTVTATGKHPAFGVDLYRLTSTPT